jgi:hypothetical protein
MFMTPNYALVMHASAARLPSPVSDSSRLALDGCHSAGRNKPTNGFTNTRGIPATLSVLLHPGGE